MNGSLSQADERTGGSADERTDRVYKYGCRAPREAALAEQLLGQAWLYREELRRIQNDHHRDLRLLDRKDDAGHVRVWLRNRALEQTRTARSRRGHLLDNGTYWLIEDAVLQASKANGLDPIRRSQWDGTGRIGAAIQSVQKFPADDWNHKRARLTAPNERGHAELTIAVGAVKDGREITWPIKLHRPFPKGAIVKRVAVQRTRVGHRFRWEALVTISTLPTHHDREAKGVVGVDLGWRREGPKTMRVATHAGANDVGTLCIDTLESFLYADSVKGFRDLAFDAAKAYVKDAALPGAEHAHLWKDKDRMRRLARVSGELGPAWWNERDKHLEDIECGVRARAIRRRLDAFRTYADALARRYRTVVLEDMPMADWVGEAETHAKERRRSVAALGLLQNVIAGRFGPERTDWAPAAYTSMTCADCGYIRSEKIGPQVEWICASCGAVHHQDENAAEVLRQDGERWSDAGNAVRARTRKAKKGAPKQRGDGIATGDEIRSVVTAREPIASAAE